jgi:hypothetical protein
MKRALGIAVDMAGFLITLVTGPVAAGIVLVPILQLLLWLGVLP